MNLNNDKIKVDIDDFITNLPEITFFKSDNKRYTKFSLFSYIQEFKGNNQFGELMQCNLEKIGDLINKIYIKITLPKIKIYKNNQDIIDDNNNILILQNKLLLLQDDYSISKSFYKIIYQGINIIKNQLLLKFNLNNIILKINSILISTNKQIYDNILNTNLYSKKLNQYDLFNFFLSNQINKIIDTNNDLISVININNYIDNIIRKLNTDNIYYLDNIIEINRQISHYSKNIYDIKWIENIGQYIIENFIINIGGINITSYDSDYLNIYNDIYKDDNMKNIYKIMIGNVINYDNNNDIILYIPLIFWFNREYTQSLPCISMRNSEINISIKINDIEKCVIYDKTKNLNNNLQKIQIKNISLYIDHIFLSNKERIFFGQNQHNYIIEDPQINKFKLDLKDSYSFKLDFSSNIKELFWIVKNNYNLDIFKKHHNFANLIMYKIINITGNLQTINLNIGIHIFNIGDNIIISDTLNYNGHYTISNISNTSIYINQKYVIDEKGIIQIDISNNINNNNDDFNTISKSSIKFHGNECNKNNDSIYYNIIQAYQYHNSCIQQGLNIYNFGLYPDSSQTSGHFNFSDKIDQTLDITLSNLFYNYCKNNVLFEFSNSNNLIIKIYGVSYKIIKFTNGTIQIVL